VLKDDPPEQLIAAVRTVAAGNALLSPAITKHVISRFTRIARPAPPKELSELTERETEILRLIAGGLSNAEIGRKLYISETTVKTHVTHILAKLGLRDRVQAVVLAYQAALFEQAPGELPLAHPLGPELAATAVARRPYDLRHEPIAPDEISPQTAGY
jgi:DNA-binding NarL/FixJ family response regulator